MRKTYDYIEDEEMMVGEPVMATYSSSAPIMHSSSSRSSEAPTAYTIEELDAHLEESELQFKTGSFLTMEEADRDMELFVKALR